MKTGGKANYNNTQISLFQMNNIAMLKGKKENLPKFLWNTAFEFTPRYSHI